MSENLDASTASDDQNESASTAQQAEDNDVSTLTLNDILEMENEYIEDAAAVLGASSDKCCSYNDGYLKRQALYSCLTCIPESRSDPEKSAGICLACSYHCHDGHELVELYTKRSFRCDCGNSKFSGTSCKCNLTPDKSEINEGNAYNQNFGGLYCICHRPYPDPEDPMPDEMIQCIICEDWYHSRHLGSEVPSGSFAEMICSSCVAKHEFLLHYDENPAKNKDESAVVDVTSTTDNNETETSTSQALTGEEEKGDQENNPSQVEKKCKKPLTKQSHPEAKFYPDLSWRKELCTCAECLDLYKTENVMFLVDPEDPVQLYEEKGKNKVKEVIETSDRNFMNSMGRVQLVEVIAGYNDLKENLADYLRKFAENRKVVKEEDIKEFFDGMMARKKQKVSVPYHCH